MKDFTIKGLLLAILITAFAGIPFGMFVIWNADQKIITGLHDKLKAEREPFEDRRFALRYGCDRWYCGEVEWDYKKSDDGKNIWYARILNP